MNRRTQWIVALSVSWLVFVSNESASGGNNVGPPGIDPADEHRLVKNGDPWYPAGYYPGLAALTVRDPGESLKSYSEDLIDELAEHGLNYFRTVFTMGQPNRWLQGFVQTLPYPRTGGGSAVDGGPKFDLDQFDSSHFDYWKDVLKYAQSKGVVVQLTLLDSWHNNRFERTGEDADWGQQFDFYYGENNINGVDISTENDWHSSDKNSHAFLLHKAVIERAVDELGMFDNLVWEVCNEAGRAGEPGSFLDWEMDLAEVISAREMANGFPRHLVMPRDLPNHQHAGGQMGQDFDRHHDELVENFFSLGQPLIADNDTSGGHFPNAQGRRRKAWAVLTAGAHIDYFHGAMRDFSVLHSADVTNGMRWIGHTIKFIDDLGVTLRGMEPHDDLVSAGSWSLARPGEEYVIYMRKNNGYTYVAVYDLPLNYNATWFNPRSGASQPATAGPIFTPPSQTEQDWVLHIVSFFPLPAAPSGVEAEVLVGEEPDIRISWSDNSDNEDAFEIQRRVVVGGDFALLATVGADEVATVDTTTESGTTYLYRVRAGNAEGTSDWSSSDVVSTPPGLAAPSDLTWDGLTAQGCVEDPSGLIFCYHGFSFQDHAAEETRFEVQRRALPNGSWKHDQDLAANEAGFVVALKEGEDHSGIEIRILACDATDCSPPSNVAEIPPPLP